MEDKKPWYKNGIRFECQGSGKCCVSRGEYGFVYLTLEDRQKIAELLGLTTLAFTKKYCEKSHGIFHLRQPKNTSNCAFLNKKNKCTIYKARPAQCSTWPFWPEVMDAKSWKQEVVKFCPGVGKGRIHSFNEIQEQIRIHNEWEENL